MFIIKPKGTVVLRAFAQKMHKLFSRIWEIQEL